MAGARKATALKSDASVNQGQWIITCVLEDREGNLREATRFELKWAESQMKKGLVGTLSQSIIGRTREVLTQRLRVKV